MFFFICFLFWYWFRSVWCLQGMVRFCKNLDAVLYGLFRRWPQIQVVFEISSVGLIWEAWEKLNACFSSKEKKTKGFIFIKCKFSNIRNRLIAKISLISQKYFFWGYFKRQQINQTTQSLNRGLSLDLLWLWSVNHVKFTDVFVIWMRTECKF